MRKFYLENSAGSRFGLNGENGIWLDSPSGLGVSYSPKWADFKNGFFTNVNNQTKQADIVCNLLFLPPSAYGKYKTFMAWVTSAGTLTLIYNPNGTEYSRKVELEQISKSELNEFSGLLCAANFICLTPWFSVVNYSGATINSLVALGDQPSAFIIQATVTGTAPEFILKDSSNNEIGACAFNSSYSANNIEISTLPADGFITVDGNDAINDINLTRGPFFRLPLGITGNLSNTVSATMSVKMFHYWRTI